MTHGGGSRANPRGANLISANLNDADLTDAKNLTQTQLGQACGKPQRLPPGLVLDELRCPEAPVASPLNLRTTP